MNEADIAAIQRTIVTVGALSHSGALHVCGSAFLIYATAEHRMYLTAAHVVEQAMRYALPQLDARPGGVGWRKADFDRMIQSRRLIVSSEQFPFGRIPQVLAICASSNDLGLITTESIRPGIAPKHPVAAIDSDVFPIGTRVCAWLPRITEAPVADDPRSLEVSREISLAFGEIRGIYKRSRLVRSPVYSTTIPLVAGMSGSPLFAVTSDDEITMAAIGVMSSSLPTWEQEESGVAQDESHAVLSAMTYGLQSPRAEGYQGHDAGHLAGLIASGLVKDHGRNASRIRVEVEGDDFRVTFPTGTFALAELE